MSTLQEHNDSTKTSASGISGERKAGGKRRFKTIPAFTENQLRRFWALVDRRGPEECWPWLGTVTTGRWGAEYGIWRGYRPHRIARTVLVGPIPDDLTLDHIKGKCAVGALCCNPAHTEAVTQSENTLRYIRPRLAKKTCKRGHFKLPYERCRICAEIHMERYYEKRGWPWPPNRLQKTPQPQPQPDAGLSELEERQLRMRDRMAGRPADSTTRTQEGAR